MASRNRYFCKKCAEYLFEEGLPNINKRHTCGEHLRLEHSERVGEKRQHIN